MSEEKVDLSEKKVDICELSKQERETLMKFLKRKIKAIENRWRIYSEK